MSDVSFTGKDFPMTDRQEPMPERGSGRYYLVDTTRSKGRDFYTFWRPDARGYTENLNEAGLYSEADAIRYTANADDCFAILADDAIANSWSTRYMLAFHKPELLLFPGEGGLVHAAAAGFMRRRKL